MIDFPASPTTGQIFTAPNGTQWTWDSVKWTQGAASSGFLPLAGGTMTGDIVLAHDPPAALNPATKQYVDAQNSHYRNRIINGDMSVDQRNGGVLITNPAAGVYAIDRWKFASGVASKGNIGQYALTAATAVGGFIYALSWATATAYAVAAGDSFQFYQVVEGNNFNDALWGTAKAQSAVLEFWAQSSIAGTYAGSLRNGAANRSYAFTFAIAAANVWQKFRIAIPGDTAGTWAVSPSAAAISLNFNLGSGATFQTAPNVWTAGNFISAPGAVSVVGTLNATFFITGVALMVGAAAANAEPEFRKYGDNLIDCKRYFQSLSVLAGNYQSAGGSAWTGFTLPVSMRVAPTAVLSGISYGNASGLTAGNITTTGFAGYVVATGTGGTTVTYTTAMDADF
jgi:hypothetical protein